MDKNRASFTLIEVLIVSVLIIIMSGGSIAIFSSYRDNKILQNQTQLFVSILELAKNKAIAGDVSLCENSDIARTNGYTVTVDSALKKITLIPTCDTTPTPVLYTIPTDIVFEPSAFTVQFDSQNYSGPTSRYILKNNLTNTCTFVDIDITGLITNGDVSCT